MNYKSILFVTFFSIITSIGLTQMNFSFQFRKGLKFHYKGEISSDPEGYSQFANKQVINDYIEEVDTIVKKGDIEFVEFKPNKISSSSNNAKLNFIRNFKGLIFYKNVCWQVNYSKRNSKAYWINEIFSNLDSLKEILSLPKDTFSTYGEKGIEYYGLNITPFLNFKNPLSCKVYFNIQREVAAEPKYNCFKEKTVLPTTYGGQVRVVYDPGDIIRDSKFTYWISDKYFISKFQFSIRGTTLIDLVLYKID